MSISESSAKTSIGIGLLAGLLTWGCEQSTGGPSDFEVQGDPSHSLRVLSPNGGESVQAGDSLKVRIAADPSTDYLVNVRLSWDGGKNWETLTRTESVPVKGVTEVRFFIPDSVVHLGLDADGAFVEKRISLVSDSCFIEIYDYEQTHINDRSDGPFRITGE